MQDLGDFRGAAETHTTQRLTPAWSAPYFTLPALPRQALTTKLDRCKVAGKAALGFRRCSVTEAVTSTAALADHYRKTRSFYSTDQVLPAQPLQSRGWQIYPWLIFFFFAQPST
jgi:hypothetical protein